MPNGGRTGRAIAKSQGAFVTPIVTNNPVFQVKLADVDDKLEQPAGQQKEMKDEIRRGEAVIGTALGKDNKKKHKGIVQNIVKDANGNVTSFTITDEDGDQIKLDPTSVARLDLHDEGKNKTAGDTFKVMESNRAKSFEDFINEQMTSDEPNDIQAFVWLEKTITQMGVKNYSQNDSNFKKLIKDKKLASVIIAIENSGVVPMTTGADPFVRLALAAAAEAANKHEDTKVDGRHWYDALSGMFGYGWKDKLNRYREKSAEELAAKFA